MTSFTKTQAILAKNVLLISSTFLRNYELTNSNVIFYRLLYSVMKTLKKFQEVFPCNKVQYVSNTQAKEIKGIKPQKPKEKAKTYQCMPSTVHHMDTNR